MIRRIAHTGVDMGVWLLLISMLLHWDLSATPFTPIEPTGQPWRIVSFIEDAGLKGCNVLNLAFSTHSGTNGEVMDRIWVATSDGLREYDGYHWRRHGTAQGLPSDFVRSVLVTRSGELWVGTDRGAGVYRDGVFYTHGSETNLAGLGVRRMVEDPDGTVWFCSDPWPNATQRGGVTSYQRGKWQTYQAKDGLPSEYVINYFRDSAGYRWAVTKKGLAELKGRTWEKVLTPPLDDPQFTAGSFAHLPGVGTVFSAGLRMFVREASTWVEIDNARHHTFGICSTRDGRLFGALNVKAGRKRIGEWTTNGWNEVSHEFEAPYGYTEDIQEAPDGNLWVVGFETLICWRRNSQWREFSGVSQPRFVDKSGGVWFGPRHASAINAAPTARFLNGRWEAIESLPEELALDSHGAVWGSTSNAVTRWFENQELRFGESDTGLRSVFEGKGDRGGTFWLMGLDPAGDPAVAWFENAHWSTRKVPELRAEHHDAICHEASHGIWFLVKSLTNATAAAIHVTQDRTDAVPIPLTRLSEFRSGLWAGRPDTELWLYGDSGLFRRPSEAGEWEAVKGTENRSVMGLMSRGEEVWVGWGGARGALGGLTRLFPENEQQSFAVQKILSMSLAHDNTLLIGCADRFAFVADTPKAAPIEVRLPNQLSVDSVVKDPNTGFWVGNATSTLLFVPDQMPPETEILNTDTEVLAGKELTIRARGVERFRPYNDHSNLGFSFKLDDEPWGVFELSPTRVIQTKALGLGRHTIQVRARDQGGDVDATAAEFTFTIHPLPIQNRPWFPWAVLGTITLLVVLALMALRARIEISHHARVLETKVAERTAALEADAIERQKVQEALRVSEARLKSTMDQLLEGCQIISFDWRYIYLNRVAAKHARREPADLLGRSLPEVYPSLIGGPLHVAMQRSMEKREVVQLENQFTYDDGSFGIFELEIQPVTEGILIHSIDVTSRKQAEAVVQEAQARFQQVTENIREVFWLTNLEKNHMLYISPAYERIWGRSCRSLYENPASWLEAILPEDRDRILQSAHSQQSSGEYDVEYRIVRPDGVTRWIHDRAFPVRDASGQVYRVAGIAEDITERRELEAQFRQAQKMEALGTLSGGIAHDFNNILGAVFGNVHLARLDLETTHPARLSLLEIERAAERARSLVRQILAFSRQQPQDRAITSLAPIVREAAGLLRATIPAGVELRRRIDPDAPHIFADASQIHQVILNLCTNAWHALAGKSGRIEIELSQVEIQEVDSSLPSGLHRGRYACLTVRDNGRGMDPATLNRIFEPFFTTKEPGKGTGLGLAVVHGIMQSHDGVIDVVSKPGEGTTFRLYFPAVEAPQENQSQAPDKLRRGSGQRILYLDDESPLVELAVRMLRHLGYQAEGYTQPLNSLDAIRSDPRRYDLVITDLHMPGQSGLDFAQSVRKLRPEMPIMLSSGLVTEEIVKKAQAVGITRLLHKPNSMEEFSTSIGDYLNP